jgi:uncharacterized protein HemY
VIRGIWRDVCYHLVDGGVVQQARSGQSMCGLRKWWQHLSWSKKDVSFYILESQKKTDRRTIRE